jgi:UDP-glucuronate 4-epimerase
MAPMQPGDVVRTYADTTAIERDFGFKPSTSLETGLKAFVAWYREYFKV